jgi:hypothetical protein
VNRDAERERLILEWDLGYPEDEGNTPQVSAPQPATPPA